MNELPATREEMLTFLRESDISDSWVMDAMAAEQGEAQYNLGVMYANGEGVAKDDEESVKWYRKAAEQGHAEAQFSLGLMYAFGEGVAKDLEEAVKWIRKAAEQGLAAAKEFLKETPDK